MSECCCNELLWLKYLKPRFDQIDAQLELLVAANERALREAQTKIDALTAKFGVITEIAEATVDLPEPQT